MTMTMTMSDETLIADVTAAVRNYMSQYDASHDFLHIQRVLANALFILDSQTQLHPEKQYDRTIVTLGALCHDVGDHKYMVPGENIATKIQDLLVSCGASPSLAAKVQKVGTHVSWKLESANPAKTLAVIDEIPELAVVQDADRLDAIGAVGIGRTFTYGGVVKKATMEETIVHFGEKLTRLEKSMKTETGKRLAQERTQRLHMFQAWWMEEVGIVEGLDEIFRG